MYDDCRFAQRASTKPSVRLKMMRDLMDKYDLWECDVLQDEDMDDLEYNVSSLASEGGLEQIDPFTNPRSSLAMQVAYCMREGMNISWACKRREYKSRPFARLGRFLRKCCISTQRFLD